MDVAARVKHHGQTSLHWAAGGAHVETVEILVRHGAPVNARDETWGVTPLRWALYGWETRWSPRATPERYYRVVAMLVVAGATVSPEWLELEKVRGDPQLMAALESRM
jgi:Ankyrin repeat